VPKPSRPSEREKEGADRAEAEIVDEDDDELGVLLDRRDDLNSASSVRAVADHHEYIAFGRRELHADARRIS